MAEEASKPKQSNYKGNKPYQGGKPPQKGGKPQQGGRPQRGPPLSPAQQRRRGDVLQVSLPDMKIKKVLEFKEGSQAFIMGGAHVGTLSEIKGIEIKDPTTLPENE